VREPVSNLIVLYDGVCALCNRGVRFLLKRDRHDHFRFASLQSDFASALLRRHGVDVRRLDSVYIVADYGHPNESLLARADAVFDLMRGIGGAWNAVGLLKKILPKCVRDRCYDLIAHHRYRFCGQYESCSLPEERHRHKFLDGRLGEQRHL
jgi:predicted DCC family thiol-disulfide oxidoreductase YuxK